MLDNSFKKDVYYHFSLIFLISFFNFLLGYKNYGILLFFFESSNLQTSFWGWLNYYFGFSFLPFLMVSFRQLIHSELDFYLYFFFMLFLDSLFGFFHYGGAFAYLARFYLGPKLFVLYVCFNLSLVWFWLLLLSWKSEKKPKIERRKKNSFFHIEVESEADSSNKIFLPHKDILSIGPKAQIFIDLEKQKALLIKTLSEFGVVAKVVDVFVGPVVSLYSIELEPGTKAIRVINLSSDIARSMEAFSVRISQILGKNLLGVEISNPKRQTVYFKEGISSNQYENFEGNLPLYLGCNIYGEHEIFDLSGMPHLLVAGTTGSGKSVGIHTMLLSLFFQKTYEEFKLILIDPKKLELTPYEDIPHLLFPVVTEPKDAIRAVKWAVNEMESRYKAMSKIGVRNITSYNSKILELKKDDQEESFEKFPYIVVIIDEMADLMLLVGKEFEIYVQRLAQMGRAAGVHMIIATQRPSVDVITGTIKANFPTRISFKLSTKIDSRTILGDMSGAEQLLGAGDMLFLGNDGKVKRVHGSYVSEQDVLLVVDFLRSQAAPRYIDLDSEDISVSLNSSDGAFLNDEDPLYEEAIKMIKIENKVSTSFLQRCFPIGYNRAAKLIEKMEKDGVISKGDKFGRNREILV